MNLSFFRLMPVVAGLSFLAGIDGAHAGVDISQRPLFTTSGQPPLNMLVMGKDTKNYYEAYNDASDLDGDGALDIGYKPDKIDYYGYFNSYACYTHDGDKFVPDSATADKKCSGKWSGDFLNYVTTSRMDALRRVLYGGWRQTDSTTQTILQGAYFPQDGHSWGKEYQSVARDGYDISSYTPLSAPQAGYYHLFAMTTLKGNDNSYPNYQAPVLRVLRNTDKRVWNWVSIEGPVAGNKCFTTSNSRVDCVTSGGQQWDVLPASWYSGLTIKTWKRSSGSGSPGNATEMANLFTTYAVNGNRCGSGSVTNINATGGNNNPFVPGAHSCGQDNYLTQISGTLVVPAAGTYRLGVDGDDAVEVWIDGALIGGWYGGHGSDRSNNGLNNHSWDVSLTAGNHAVVFRHQEGSGDDNWGLLSRTTVPAATRDPDYLVRVLSCPSDNAAVREATCKKYPNGQYKPTGILHDYGETQRMYFGLISGSQFDNLQGGVLRRNMSNFGSEIEAATGQFKTDVNGIANTISEFRMIGGGYDGSATDNTNADHNWNWANGTGNCPSQGNRALANGECRMWGNPIAEMMYESLRYFAGASAATPDFSTGGATQGTTEEATMKLHTDTWKDPYKSATDGGGGFLSCSKPFQTVISDINPSYDGDLPGTVFSGTTAPGGTKPSAINGFNAADEGQAIWNSEFGAGSKKVFIGEAGGVTDGAPTVKTASSFGNIRGLAPEEPTKGGTYYSASVARFARMHDISAADGQQNLSTYSIALASPLPRIEFPVGDGDITLLPFAKTVSGTFGDSATHKATNTIVDFYVEKIVNLPNQPTDVSTNGGRPYAVFRINYEDVEQGNDHDMDAIVRYEISANIDSTVTVHLTSEYAAGSANQVMGYVLSGTTKDGVYLEVRDTDSPTCRYVDNNNCGGGFKPYALNTPPGRDPGYCAGNTSDECGLMPLEATRTFTPAAGSADAIQLNNPLWYAAKYGAPDPTNDDVDGDGVPDNYFLVTNPARLRQQLDKAFQDIITQSQPTASVATSTPRLVSGSTLVYEASYDAKDWSGDLKAYKLQANGIYDAAHPIWKASAKLPAAADRKIFTSKAAAASATSFDGLGASFDTTTFGSTSSETAIQTRLMTGLDTTIYNVDDLINFLRGDQSKEEDQTPPGPYRNRSTPIGDILNSSPAVVGVTSYGYGQILLSVAPAQADSYAAFVSAKKNYFGDHSENPVIFVGANDGMMHAFDGSNSGGKELFAYMPNGVLGTVGQLAPPGYSHRYFVDGTPTVSDAYLGGWKSVLAASTGAGGRSVFALDVTDPRNFTASDVLWELNSDSPDADASKLGQSIGRPWIGYADDGNWVAAFGNGYNSEDGKAYLLIRNLSDGSKVATVAAGDACEAHESGCDPTSNGLSMAVLVDNDGNGGGDTVYAGDYLGNLWRFEVDGSTWKLGNDGKPLFVAKDANGKRQPITSGVFTASNPLGGTMVVFGTGRYLGESDADGTSQSVDSVYGIWDDRVCSDVQATHDSDGNLANVKCKTWTETPQTITRSALQQQLFTGYTPLDGNGSGGELKATRNGVDYGTGTGQKMGWYLDLSYKAGTAPDALAGARVIARPDGILSDTVINVMQPQGNSCEPGVLNMALVLDTLTGAADYVPVNGGGDRNLAGILTYSGPPPGEPTIGVNVGSSTIGSGGLPQVPLPPPPVGTTPDDCDPTLYNCSSLSVILGKCSWVSPNPSGRPPGKPMPCGRISWKQLQ